jgi:hypothetical protein
MFQNPPMTKALERMLKLKYWGYNRPQTLCAESLDYLDTPVLQLIKLSWVNTKTLYVRLRLMQ